MPDNIFRNSSVVEELENESTIPFSTFTPTRTPLQRLLQPPHLSQSNFSFCSLCSALPTPLLHSFISLYLSFRVTSGGRQGVGEEEEGEGGRRPGGGGGGGGGGECCDAIGHRLTTPEEERREERGSPQLERAPTDASAAAAAAAATSTPPLPPSQGTTDGGMNLHYSILS